MSLLILSKRGVYGIMGPIIVSNVQTLEGILFFAFVIFNLYIHISSLHNIKIKITLYNISRPGKPKMKFPTFSQIPSPVTTP